MKTTMTENDKKLLVAMFIGVIIVAIGYWGIRPQVKRFNALQTKIEKEEAERKVNQTKITNLSLIEMQADEYADKIVEKRDEFYQTMKSSEIDRMMTELATDNHLDIYELSFTMPEEPTERMAYEYSSLYEEQQALKKEFEKMEEDELDDSSSDDSDDKEGSTSDKSSKGKTTSSSDVMAEVMGGEEGGYQPNTDIYAVPVTMTVGGEIEDLEQFIEDIINSDKRILLVGYNWGEFRDVIKRDANGNVIRNESGNSSTGTITSTVEASGEGVSAEELEGGTLEVVVKKSLTIRLEIYMCDTADVASTTDASFEESENDAEVTEDEDILDMDSVQDGE